jgi:hypothetical protein
MLLLSPGKTLFRHLTEANRYAPVADGNKTAVFLGRCSINMASFCQEGLGTKIFL